MLEWYQRTQRSEYEKNLLIKKLTKLAHHDALTGLFNKGSLATRFEQCRQAVSGSGETLFLIVLDIDYFKQYNDTYGHVAGDACLQAVSGCIERSLRKSSDAAFRFGGEEFIILTLSGSVTQAVKMAQRIQTALQDAQIPHQASAHSPWVTASFGVAPWTPGMTLDELIAEADTELYRAKRAGRNRIAFPPGQMLSTATNDAPPL